MDRAATKEEIVTSEMACLGGRMIGDYFFDVTDPDGLTLRVLAAEVYLAMERERLGNNGPPQRAALEYPLFSHTKKILSECLSREVSGQGDSQRR